MTTNKRECDQMFGDWFDPPGKDIPDCQDSNLVNNTGSSETNLCQPLDAPAHGTIACGLGFPFYLCTATCDPGYEFPNNMTTNKRECDQMFGDWFDPPGKDIPDCQDSNLVNNTGSSETNLCQPLDAPAHGTIACGLGFPFYSCTGTCDPGYE
ncbi:hypothetical protein MAR_034898, partial [Mya arenaria]